MNQIPAKTKTLKSAVENIQPGFSNFKPQSGLFLIANIDLSPQYRPKTIVTSNSCSMVMPATAFKNHLHCIVVFVLFNLYPSATKKRRVCYFWTNPADPTMELQISKPKTKPFILLAVLRRRV